MVVLYGSLWMEDHVSMVVLYGWRTVSVVGGLGLCGWRTGSLWLEDHVCMVGGLCLYG